MTAVGVSRYTPGPDPLREAALQPQRPAEDPTGIPLLVMETAAVQWSHMINERLRTHASAHLLRALCGPRLPGLCVHSTFDRGEHITAHEQQKNRLASILG